MNIACICANYPNPQLDCGRDAEADAIAEKFKAQRIGSGTCLFGNYMRDIQYEVPTAKAEALATALRKAGFRVEQEYSH